jgi:hypothetical protein
MDWIGSGLGEAILLNKMFTIAITIFVDYMLLCI